MTLSDSSTDAPAAAPTMLSKRNVESIVALRPLQHALLFHRVPGADDPGFIQVRLELEGPVDVPALETAWRRVFERHAALRMSIHAANDGDARIVVWKRLPLACTELDWRGIPAETQAERMQAFLEDDRRRGLDVGHPPVMRLAVIRMDDRTTEVVWSCHHLFLDGWSTALVVDEVLGLYASGDRSPDAAMDDGRRYLAWLRGQDPARAAAFWRDRLAEFVAPPPLRLGSSEDRGTASGFGEEMVALAPASSGRLARAGADQHLTASTLLQGAWALVLSRWQNRDDVVFGTTVSGRAANVPGIESMVGLLANVLPVRVTIARDRSVSSWLTALRDAQFAAQAFEHCDLADIQAWSGTGGGRPLFESLLVVENFPSRQLGPASDGLVLRSYRSDVTSTYPLTITAVPGETWALRGRFDRGRFHGSAVRELLQIVGRTLDLLGSEPEAMVADVRAGLDAPTAAPERVAENGEAGGRHRPGSSFVAPRNASEYQLVRIWEEALGVSPIGLRDDFFALGGRSINAVRVFGQIEELFGKRLPVTLILEHPTLERLAPVVERAHAPETWKSLVPIQTGGTRPPLFFVHGGAEEAFLFRGLARQLGADQPVYVLQSIGPEGDRTPPETIEVIAAHYIREVRSVQPEGPYRLIGYCFGGTVAFEIARQLLARGGAVAFLGVLDAFPPLIQGPLSLRRKVLRLIRRRGIVEATTLCARLAARWPYDRLRSRWSRRFGGSEGRRRTELEAMRHSFRQAYHAYRPEPIDLPITMIQAAENEWLDGDAVCDWESLASRLETHLVPGGHTTMLLDPAVENVAKIIGERLHDVQTGP